MAAAFWDLPHVWEAPQLQNPLPKLDEAKTFSLLFAFKHFLIGFVSLIFAPPLFSVFTLLLSV